MQKYKKPLKQYYEQLRDIIKYSHYAYKIESGIFEFSISYIIYNKIDYSNFSIYYNYHFNNIKYNLIWIKWEK